MRTLFLRTAAGWLVLALYLLISGLSHAGGGPMNVLVVVNDQSIESQELGHYYQQARGIPERNICHVSFDPLEHRPYPDTFKTAVVDRVHAHIVEQGLEQQIDYVLLSKEMPYAVRWAGDNNRQNATTAVFYYGFKNYTFTGNCEIHNQTTNLYYFSERAFSHSRPTGTTNGYITMMMTGYDLEQTFDLVDRNLSADGAMPSEKYYLWKGQDNFRNVRYKLFDAFDFQARFDQGFPGYSIQEGLSLFLETNVLGYSHGAANPTWINNHTYLPGAMADHLTSQGGFLFDPGSQMSILDWLQAGASASYGTVTEPCAYTEKFPDPMCFFWQARGFNNGEAYAMSVKHPYQGIFVGDPLAAPFAQPGSISLLYPTPGSTVSGIITMEVAVATNAMDPLVQAVDLYVDGLFSHSVTTYLPTAGNELVLELDGVTSAYTVAAGDDLYAAVSGLVQAVNLSAHQVHAAARGDRMELVYTNFGMAGSGLQYTASALIGTAGVQTVFAQAQSTNLLECIYPGFEYIVVVGEAGLGDTVDCDITLTNGVTVTNRIVATNGEVASQVMSRLFELVNSNSELQGSDGVFATNLILSGTYGEAALVSRETGPQVYNLFVDFQVNRGFPLSGLEEAVSFSDNFNDNGYVLTARGSVLFRAGRTNVQQEIIFDTTPWANGPHEVRAVSRDGTAVEVQSHAAVTVTFSNSPMTAALLGVTNGQQVFHGSNVSMYASYASVPGTLTGTAFYVEGKLFSMGTATAATWNAGNYGMGDVSVQVRGWDNLGNSAWSAPLTVQVDIDPYKDTDGDGLGDQWEQAWFKSILSKDGTEDTDGDGESDLAEYIADLNPTNSSSFTLSGISQTNAEAIYVEFLSSSARVYAAEYVVAHQTNIFIWSLANTNGAMGVGGPDVYFDDGTDTIMLPVLSTSRMYRIDVSLP